MADVVKLERFGELSATNLIEAIQAKKRPALDRFIFGLGIRHVGAKTATDIAKQFVTLDDLLTLRLIDLRRCLALGRL